MAKPVFHRAFTDAEGVLDNATLVLEPYWVYSITLK